MSRQGGRFIFRRCILCGELFVVDTMPWNWWKQVACEKCKTSITTDKRKEKSK